MTNAQDRRQAVALVDEARQAGARLQSACIELGIGLNTYRRWATGDEDRRPHAIHATEFHFFGHIQIFVGELTAQSG